MKKEKREHNLRARKGAIGDDKLVKMNPKLTNVVATTVYPDAQRYIKYMRCAKQKVAERFAGILYPRKGHA